MQKKILVIDDEQPTLNMCTLLLSAYGYQVVTATDGAKGLESFQQERPGIVLTDIKMPIMDGIEVLKRIKLIDSNAEVIVITGHGDMDLAILALNLDATDFINKPVKREALGQALKRAEERIALSRCNAEAISVEDCETSAILSIRGNITACSELFLTEAMDQARSLGRPCIIVDFDENASISGAGLALVTQLVLRAQERGETIRIAGLSENFRKVFEVIGIAKLATVYDTRAAALAAR